MIYECRHFSIEELVPQATLNYLGHRKCWWLFDPEALMCIDLLRDDLGPCTINDWKWGGTFDGRGFRPPSEPGAKYSFHRFGKAFDMVFGNVDADEAREHIRQNRERFHWVRAMELGVSWLHIDNRNYDGLLEFHP